MSELYTIGHSNHTWEVFLDLLKPHQINALCDVRSQPASKRYSHFNYQVLKKELLNHDIAYVFLGKELGGRPEDPTCYNQEGQVQYAHLAKTQNFQAGISRLHRGITRSYRIVLMCVEKEPLHCHRAILIGHQLSSPTLTIKHILADGSVETQPEVEQRLSRLRKLSAPDLITNYQQLVELSYQLQSEKIAYITPQVGTSAVCDNENLYEPNPTLHYRFYPEDGPTIF